MMQIIVHSQNLRGNLNEESLTLITSLLSVGCECTSILLQDIGLTGPEGPPILRDVLGDHHLLINFSMTNKARTVALIIHKSWSIHRTMKDESGSLVGAVAMRGGLKILIISAYMPATLDNYGAPIVWQARSTKQGFLVQNEAHAIYCTLREWTNSESYWIIGGDLNETRAQVDRKSVGKIKVKPISSFLTFSKKRKELMSGEQYFLLKKDSLIALILKRTEQRKVKKIIEERIVS